MIDAGQERGFYNNQYRQFLCLPDHALAIDRAVLEKNLDNPRHPFYERRRLYRAAMAALQRLPLPGRHVLDYGCGPGDFGVWMATEGAEVTLLDLSPVAIELALKRAVASGVASRVRGIAAHAAHLDMLADCAFDLVFACASLHHTLKYPGAVKELARVMNPGARLVLAETWGRNPLLNLARRLRARAAEEAEEQGEGLLMSHRQLRLLEPYFDNIGVQPMNLLAMAKRLLRGRLHRPADRALLAMFESADRALLALCPPLRHWCGEAVVTAVRRS